MTTAVESTESPTDSTRNEPLEALGRQTVYTVSDITGPSSKIETDIEAKKAEEALAAEELRKSDREPAKNKDQDDLIIAAGIMTALNEIDAKERDGAAPEGKKRVGGRPISQEEDVDSKNPDNAALVKRLIDNIDSEVNQLATSGLSGPTIERVELDVGADKRNGDIGTLVSDLKVLKEANGKDVNGDTDDAKLSADLKDGKEAKPEVGLPLAALSGIKLSGIELDDDKDPSTPDTKSARKLPVTKECLAHKAERNARFAESHAHDLNPET